MCITLFVDLVWEIMYCLWLVKTKMTGVLKFFVMEDKSLFILDC